MEHQTAIVTRGLGRDFQSASRPPVVARALDALELEVPRGIVFGFLGPNGAGKTTTIRLLLGLLEPTRGTATVLGLDTRLQAPLVREQCGALLEHSGLYERLSAEANLDLQGRIYRLSAKDRRSRVQELLEQLGLWDRRGEPLASWSRGMKQKVAVARALLHRPRLLFLDEPTAGLDPVAAAGLREELAELADTQKVTVFLTTHNLAEAERLCARVAIIRAGVLLASGSPAELRASRGADQAEIRAHGADSRVLDALRARPEVIDVGLHDDVLRIALRPRVELAPIVAHLVHAGVAVEEVRRGSASLEDAFLDLVESEPDAAGDGR